MHRSDYLPCMAMAVKQQGLLGDKEGKNEIRVQQQVEMGYKLVLQIVVSSVKSVRSALQAKVRVVDAVNETV